uniref:Reverse transcriptase domain-containing protein n=1 Tax=Trichogramma kaykai TaxID=54128 RepID=A0ABD2XH53_9HYME
MWEAGTIEPSGSPYRSNIFLVPKPADKNGKKRYRLVVDFRALNEKTIPDRYPLPNILDIIDQVGGAKYFSTLDLSNGFYQVLLKEEDRHKTAFSTEFGLFHFKKLPMGCSNAPATFQRAMGYGSQFGIKAKLNRRGSRNRARGRRPSHFGIKIDR